MYTSSKRVLKTFSYIREGQAEKDYTNAVYRIQAQIIRHQSYFKVVAAKGPRQVARWVDTKLFVTVVATVRTDITHQRVRHVLNAIGARERGRKWRQRRETSLDVS